MSTKRSLVPCLAAALGLAAACRPDVGADPSAYAARVAAVFDPSIGVVPMPDDLVVTGGRVAVPLQLDTVDDDGRPVVVDAFPPATAEYVRNYLNKLDGFPSGTPLTFAFSSGGIDPKTLDAASVRVFDVTPLVQAPAGADLAAIAVAEVTGLAFSAPAALVGPTGRTVWQVTATPPAPWTPGHTYLAFVRRCPLCDGTARPGDLPSVRDLEGWPVTSATVQSFLKAKEPLVDAKGVAVVPVTDAQAARLEAARLALLPLFDWFENTAPASQRIARDQSALAWRFTVSKATEAVFDPAAGRIPTPNDLLRAPDGTHLGLPLPAGTDCANPGAAEPAFLCWMNGRDGFPATPAISVAFTRPLDLSTVGDETVRVLDVTAADPVAVTGLAASWQDPALVLVPPSPLVPGHRYLVLLSSGLKGRDGDATVPSIASPAMALLRGVEPLAKDGKSLLPGVLSDADATRLEAVRVAYAPLLDALGGLVAREKIVSFFGFTVAGANEVLFDPAAGVVPFPFDGLLTRPDAPLDPATRVALPVDPSAPAAIQALVRGLDRLDGVSTVAPVTTGFALPIDPAAVALAPDLAQVGKTPVAVLDVTDVDPAKDDAPTMLGKLRVVGPDALVATASGAQLVLEPPAGKPLPPRHRYLAVLFDGLRSLPAGTGTGAPPVLDVSPAFFLARSPYPLATADGKSLLPQVLGDAAAVDLERRVRLPLAPILDAMAGLGIPRERVLLLFTFTTGTTTADLAALAAGLRSPLPWGGTLKPATDPEVKALFGSDPSGNVAEACLDCALKASILLAPPDLSDPADPRPGQFRFDADGGPLFQDDVKLPFLLFLPKGAGPHPVVVFQHGLGTSRRAAARIADDLAAAGLATVAVDAPYHGDHPVGPLPGPDGATVDGNGFFTADPLAVRDALREVALDQRQLLLFVRDRLDAFIAAQPGHAAGVVDGARVRYLGVSLGGLAGAASIGVNPELERAALVAAGGPLSRILLAGGASSPLRPPIVAALAALGLAEGTPAFARFAVLAQWALDRADPVNFGRVASFATGPKVEDRVMLVEALGDEVVPNAATEALRDALVLADGTKPRFEAYPAGGDGVLCHAFFLDGCADATRYPAAAAARAQARQAVIDFLGQAGRGDR